MRWLFIVIIGIVVLFIVSVVATPLLDDQITGYWRSARKVADGNTIETFYRIQQSGNRINGTVQFPWGDLEIFEGSVEGNQFRFTAKIGDLPFRYEGKLERGELHMTLFDPNVSPTSLVAVRTDTPGFAPPNRIEPPSVREMAANGLASTPPLGWNSWNHFHDQIDDKTVREIADAMVASGMRDAGYVYINIDDTWEGERDAQGTIHPNRKFPDMKALADYVHARGLKLGIYSSPGPKTCGGYEGSYGHEEQDAKTFAAWGIDYLKYDWCSAFRLYRPSEMRAVYQRMGDALRATGRPIVYSLCQYGMQNVWEWGAKAGGNLWRTTGDIQDKWSSIEGIGFSQDHLGPYAGPGHWNDPDMLEIGNGGMTTTEYKTHMSLWAMLAAPLIAGNDLRAMSADTIEILTNREVIAVDQDVLGKQGRRARVDDPIEYWTKPLADASTAVAIINRGDADANVSVTWPQLNLEKVQGVRDLWKHADLPNSRAGFSGTVPAHGVVMLKVRSAAAGSYRQ